MVESFKTHVMCWEMSVRPRTNAYAGRPTKLAFSLHPSGRMQGHGNTANSLACLSGLRLRSIAVRHVCRSIFQSEIEIIFRLMQVSAVFFILALYWTWLQFGASIDRGFFWAGFSFG